MRYPVQAQVQEALFALKFVQARLQDAVVTGEVQQIKEAEQYARQFQHALEKVGESGCSGCR